MRIVIVDLGRGQILELGPGTSERRRGGVDIGVGPPSGHMRTHYKVEVAIMHQRAALERRRNEAGFLHIHEVVGQLGEEETLRRTRLEDQVGGPIVVHKLPDVATLLIQRPEAFHVGICAGDAVADCDHHASEFVVRVIEMRVHYELAGARVGIHFGPLEHPMGSQMLGIGECEYLASESPVNKIARRITSDVALIGIVGLRAVFTEPVVRSLPHCDAAAVRLNTLSMVVEPRVAGPDDARRGK